MAYHVGFFAFGGTGRLQTPGITPMDKTHAPTAQCSGENSRTILMDHLAHFGPDEEHVALVANPSKFDLLRRRADFIAEGVTAIFGLAGADAELLALCFHARKFTPAEAAQWLAGRGIAPLIFVPNSDRDRLRCPAYRS
jgi:hypothetical protein